MRIIDIKHKICIIPKSAWGNNLRSYLTSSGWDKVRKKCYAENDYKCQICGGQGGNGRKHPVECHEAWEFVDGEVKLVGLMSLCPPCHEFHHPGLASAKGHTERMLKQFMKVNEVSRSEAIEYFQYEFSIWRRRSQEPWSLNIDYLKEYMGEDFKYNRPEAEDDAY